MILLKSVYHLCGYSVGCKHFVYFTMGSTYRKIETYLVWYQIKGFDKRNLFRPVLNVFGAIQIKGTG